MTYGHISAGSLAIPAGFAHYFSWRICEGRQATDVPTSITSTFTGIHGGPLGFVSGGFEFIDEGAGFGVIC